MQAARAACRAISGATFHWVGPVVATGYRRQLDEDDLFPLPSKEQADDLRRHFALQRKTAGGHAQTPRALLWSVIRGGRREIIISGVMMLLYSISQLANPILLRQLVNSIEKQEFEGIYYAVALLCSGILSAFSAQLHFHFAFAAGRKARALFISLVYAHTLELSAADMTGVSHGGIINMMSADAQKLFEISQFMHLFWAGPLQIIIATAFLISVIGLPSLAGVGVLFLIGPLNLFMAELKRIVRAKHMPLMDARVRLCNEVLAGIRVVKLFSWEMPFMEKIREARKAQLVFVFRELYLFTIVISVLILTPGLASLATFVTAGATGEILTPGNTFAALALFNVLKFPLQQISQALMLGAQVLVAVQRLFEFLNTSPKAVPLAAVEDAPPAVTVSSFSQAKSISAATVGDPEVLRAESASSTATAGAADTGAAAADTGAAAADAGTAQPPAPEDSDTCEGEPKSLIRAVDASFSWAGPDIASGEEFVLRGVDIDVRQGELFAIVGPVGCGKSTLVHSLLNELTVVDGRFEPFDGEIAYCSQTPWILNATVEENITFGKPYEEERFREVLNACCLWSDLDQLHEREKTVIGERGVTLSGGQKARISLARAAYSNSPVVILDDPLSALDAHVGKKVFRRLLAPRTGLLRNSARILVTHAAQNLSVCDKVLVMYGGRIAYQGPYSELAALHQASSSGADQALDSGASLANVMDSILLTTQTGQDALRAATSSMMSADDAAQGPEGADSGAPIPRKKKLLDRGFKSSNLMTTEERKDGTVDLSVVHEYILASGGYGWMIFVLFIMTMERLTYILNDWWLATWSDANNGPPDTPFDLPAANTTEGARYYSIGYVITYLANSVFVFGRCLFFVQGGGTAAQELFYKLAWRVLRCPMEFFETTPLGRLTNRFSFDTEVIDDLLIQSLQGMTASLAWMLSAVCVMISVTPLATVLIVPVMIIFMAVHRYYRRSCVELQRLDSTSRSPIQSQFRETLDGLPTLRAFKQELRFRASGEDKIDRNTRAIYAFVSSNRWLGVRLELLGAIVTFAVSVTAWLSRETISPGLVGLAVLWSFNLTTSFNYFVTLSTLAEAKMTSVERVVHYARLDQEPDIQTTGSAPDPSWPSQGAVTFDKVVMRYRENLPPALKSLSFRIQPGEHVGICGRTGAGKSSIAAALFRLRELSSGTVTVDGIDLAGLGLGDVRGRAITIIPQDPTLFSGTVRFNVDPFSQYSDDQVSLALNKACLTAHVAKLGGLDAQVGEAGSNLSQGQRQLMCLARAILRAPKVLLCDEMTSSVDAVTDALIQKTIRDSFANCTVITIAHRLHSIMDNDRVMVLDRGELVEFDTPAQLAACGGAFRALIDSNGPAVAKELLEMAGVRSGTNPPPPPPSPRSGE